MEKPPLKLGFLASNNGTSMRAIIAAIEAGTLAAEARLVVSNTREAPALAFAARTWRRRPASIPTAPDPEAADTALAAALKDAGVELVILSGYLRKLGPRTLAAYAGPRTQHPSGAAAEVRRPGHVRTARARGGGGCRRSQQPRVTVHVVDEEYDHGPTLIALPVPLAPSDDAATIEAKVTAAEAGVFVEVVLRICEGTLALP